MKLHKSALILLALVVLISTCTQAPPEPAVDTAADIEAIKAHEEEKATSSAAAADTEAVVDLFTDDAIAMWHDLPTAIGKEAIRAVFDDFFKRDSVDPKQTVEEVEVIGDWAWARCAASLTLTPREGGESRVEKGRYFAGDLD